MRTDKFTGWTNQPPDTGTPLFGFGYPGYMTLQDASAVPTPGPTTAASRPPGVTAGPATPAPPAPRRRYRRRLDAAAHRWRRRDRRGRGRLLVDATARPEGRGGVTEAPRPAVPAAGRGALSSA